MGTPEFSVPILRALVESSYKVSFVYTQSPKKSNRGQKLNPSPIQKYAESLKLNVRNPQKLNTDEEFKFFQTIDPDIVVVVAYGQLIGSNFLEQPKKGFLNIHASLLPRWRGAAPIQRAVMNLDKETGISMMKITKDLDSGPVIKQFKCKINNFNSAEEISNNLSKIGAEHIVETLDNIFNDKGKFFEQEHKYASYAKKIKKSEARIDWNKNAREILAKINGLNSSPGAWFLYQNVRYKIWRASISDKKGIERTILDNKFTIGCKDKSITIEEIQKEGKNKLLIKDFLTGKTFKIGDQVE